MEGGIQILTLFASNDVIRINHPSVTFCALQKIMWSGAPIKDRFRYLISRP